MHTVALIVKSGMKSKDVPAKIALGATHTTAMTGNATDPAGTRGPADAQMVAVQLSLQTTNDAADAAEIAWKQKNAGLSA